jgi:hypothetical protein
MASTFTYTIINNDPILPAVLNYITIATTLTQIQHHLQLSDWPNWQIPWSAAPYDDFQGSSTIRTSSKPYVGLVTDVIKTYQGFVSSGPYYMKLSNNTDISAGYAVSGENFTGPTVVSTSGTTWVQLSTAPAPSIPLVIGSSNITFTPPEQLLILDNTLGLAAGWSASGNGYSGQTIISVRNESVLVMSGPPSTTPTGSILFTSNLDQMITVTPGGGTQVFSMDYNNVTSAIGTYTSAVSLHFTLGSSTVIKNIINLYAINSSPVVDVYNPSYDWGGGGGGGPGSGCGTGGDGGGCSAAVCVTAGTLIRMGDGTLKVVEDIVVGDTVLTTNGISNVIKLRRSVLEHRWIWVINEHLEITGDHLIKTTAGWKCVEPDSYLNRKAVGLAPHEVQYDKLNIGDILITENGTEEFTTIRAKYFSPTTIVYTMYADGISEYFASSICIDGMLMPVDYRTN